MTRNCEDYFADFSDDAFKTAVLVPLIAPSGTPEKPENTAEFFKKHIGRIISIQSVLGRNGPVVRKTGRIVDVDDGFIALRRTETDDIILCDLYSIRFARIYGSIAR